MRHFLLQFPFHQIAYPIYLGNSHLLIMTTPIRSDGKSWQSKCSYYVGKSLSFFLPLCALLCSHCPLFIWAHPEGIVSSLLSPLWQGSGSSRSWMPLDWWEGQSFIPGNWDEGRKQPFALGELLAGREATALTMSKLSCIYTHTHINAHTYEHTCTTHTDIQTCTYIYIFPTKYCVY